MRKSAYALFILLVTLAGCSTARKAVNPLTEEKLKDVVYGKYPRNIMDIYLPAGRNEKTPFVVLIHGGAWVKAGKETSQIQSVTADQMSQHLKMDPAIGVLDVRKASEFLSEHMLDAENIPLDYINDHLAQIDKNKTYFVHCAGGYRSMIFNSVLKARGYDNLIDVRGGFKAIKDSGKLEVSNYVCPSTLL